jgi:hypothetical protein
MLTLLEHGKLYPDFSTHPDQVRKRVLLAGFVANLVREQMTDKDSIAAVDAAIAFGKGKIGIDELNQAAKAAYTAAYYADCKSVNAAYAAAFAADAAAAPDAAAAAANAVNLALHIRLF